MTFYSFFFFFFFRENRSWHFMWIIFGRWFTWNVKTCFLWKKKKKKFFFECRPLQILLGAKRVVKLIFLNPSIISVHLFILKNFRLFNFYASENKVFEIIFKGNILIHFQGRQLCFVPILKRGLFQMNRICSQGDQILSFQNRPLFRRGLVHKKAYRKS